MAAAKKSNAKTKRTAKSKAAATKAKTAKSKTVKKAASTKKSAVKKTVSKAPVKDTQSTAAKAADSGPSISAGTIVFAALILAIGLVGWYILSESDKIGDSYDEANQANSTILKRVETPANADTEATDETTEESSEQ